VGVAVIVITFSQSLADRWALFPIGRLSAPLGGFEIHVVLWCAVGLVVLRTFSSRGSPATSWLALAFLVSTVFEVAQPLLTPRNFEVADLAANMVGLSCAQWIVGRSHKAGCSS